MIALSISANLSCSTAAGGSPKMRRNPSRTAKSSPTTSAAFTAAEPGTRPGHHRPADTDRSRLDSGLGSPAKFAETIDAYEEVGVTDFVVHWPREDDPYSGDETILERIIK